MLVKAILSKCEDTDAAVTFHSSPADAAAPSLGRSVQHPSVWQNYMENKPIEIVD